MYCDRCGACGQARYIFPNGYDLVFCGHHNREYANNLQDLAVEDIEFNADLELMGVSSI